jgi:hypothetical protein
MVSHRVLAGYASCTDHRCDWEAGGWLRLGCGGFNVKAWAADG